MTITDELDRLFAEVFPEIPAPDKLGPESEGESGGNAN